jgi:branched-chain amino acid transport system ATP-binding protein
MLEVTDVVVRYDAADALRGVSLSAAEGMVTSVIGSNGAGKTTLLRAVSGLLPIASGEIRLLGERIDNLKPADIVRRGICHVPEGRELFSRMSVFDNLLTGAYLRRDKAGVGRDLDKVFSYFPILKQRAALPARSLSGGEQQMLAFGRALMASPKVLLLDEPSVGLAPLIEQSLMETVAQLAATEEVAVVLVEQNAILALATAKTGYVLDLGQFVTSGPAEGLLNDSKVRQAYLGL